MRCMKCKRTDTILVKLVQNNEDPCWVCSDDRTCEAIAQMQRQQNTKMIKVHKIAAKFHQFAV